MTMFCVFLSYLILIWCLIVKIIAHCISEILEKSLARSSGLGAAARGAAAEREPHAAARGRRGRLAGGDDPPVGEQPLRAGSLAKE